MKKLTMLILTVFLLAGITTANALYSFTDVKNDIVNELNNTVVVLKNYFKKTDEHLKEDKVIVEATKEEAEALKNSSSAKETNPVVLKHGAVNMPNCDINTEELLWNGNAWICQKPSYGTDCYPTKDEYRYEENGKIVCSKISKGQSLNYYWKFRGLGRTCGSDHKKPLVYSCYYKNKNNQEIEVDASYCSGKTKPTPANMEPVDARQPSSGWKYVSSGSNKTLFLLKSDINGSNHSCALCGIKYNKKAYWNGVEVSVPSSLFFWSYESFDKTFVSGGWTYHINSNYSRRGSNVGFSVVDAMGSHNSSSTQYRYIEGPDYLEYSIYRESDKVDPRAC